MKAFDLPQCYSDHRPRYPQQLVDDLCERTVGSEGGERLVDWGCGTGELTLRLSPIFSRVTAIDASAPMVAVGRENARREGVTNVEWLAGRAEELELEQRSCDLISSASAFHWMDREQLVKRAFEGLKPGGSLAIVTSSGSSSIRNRTAEWHSVAIECRKRHLPPRPPGARKKRGAGRADEEILGAAGFATSSFDYEVDYSWRVDELPGYLYSVGFASPDLLGDNREAFEHELRQALAEIEPSETVSEPLPFKLTIARKRDDS